MNVVGKWSPVHVKPYIKLIIYLLTRIKLHLDRWVVTSKLDGFFFKLQAMYSVSATFYFSNNFIFDVRIILRETI